MDVGISELSSPFTPEHTRLLWEFTAQEAEMMQILDCCFKQMGFFLLDLSSSQSQNHSLKLEKVKGNALPLSVRLAFLSFVFKASVNTGKRCCCSVIHCYDLK